jgi:tRNA G10  N-methylase Trm11
MAKSRKSRSSNEITENLQMNL